MRSMGKRILRIILDWDGTITQKDTLEVVAKIGYDKHNLPLNGSPKDYTPPAMAWNEVGKTYIDRYSLHQSQYTPKSDQRRTLQAEREWLASLRPVEAFGAQTAESTKVFRGVTASDVESAAKIAVETDSMTLRPGLPELLRYAMPRSRTTILSVNWSRAFIKHALARALKAKGTDDAFMSSITDNIIVEANEIQGLDQVGGSSGELRSADEADDIRTSADKLLRMPQYCQKRLKEPSTPNDTEEISLYCGDSDTDLECLLAADVGVCIQDEPPNSTQQDLASTLERLKIQTRPIGSFSIARLGNAGCLWTAHDFHEILDVVKLVAEEQEGAHGG